MVKTLSRQLKSMYNGSLPVYHILAIHNLMMIPKKNLFRVLITTLIITCSTLYSLSVQAQDYGPLKNGDSLWDIATKVSPSDSVSRYQTIIALQKLNPDAFSVTCNINSLKIGVKLKGPSLTQAEALTADQAFEEYTRQNEAWKNRKKQNIVCPVVTETETIDKTTPSSVESSEEKQPTEVTKTVNPSDPIENIPDVSMDTSTVTEDSSKSVAEVPNETDIQPIMDEIAKTDELSKISFSTDFFSLKNIAILIAVGFIVAFLIALLLHRHSSSKYVQKRVLLKNPFSDQLDEISLHVVDPDAEKSRERLKVVAVNTHDKSTGHPEVNVFKAKLTNARIYLAEGNIVEVHNLLNEVIKQGSPTQKQEAQQLLKITQSMKELQQQVASTQTETSVTEDIPVKEQSDNHKI